MAGAAITRTVQDGAGNAITGAIVEIRAEISGAPLAQLYSDRALLNSLGNPYTAPTAQFTVYLAAGRYRIDITHDGITATERDAVALEDVPEDEAVDVTEVTSGASYDAGADDREIYVNKTVGSATQINLPTAVGRTDPISIIDGKGDASTNPITIVPNGAQTIMGQSSYVINFDRGSITLKPHQDGKWYA